MDSDTAEALLFATYKASIMQCLTPALHLGMALLSAALSQIVWARWISVLKNRPQGAFPYYPPHGHFNCNGLDLLGGVLKLPTIR